MDLATEMIAALPTIKKMAHAFHHQYWWNPELDVDDLIQEASAAVWMVLPRADREHPEKHKAYLHARIWGAFLDYLGKTVPKTKPVEIDALEDEAEQDSLLSGFAYPSPEDHAVVISFLKCVFQHLTPIEKHILLRVTVEGDTMLSVGKALGVSESRVSQIVSEARKKMKAETCL